MTEMERSIRRQAVESARRELAQARKIEGEKTPGTRTKLAMIHLEDALDGWDEASAPASTTPVTTPPRVTAPGASRALAPTPRRPGAPVKRDIKTFGRATGGDLLHLTNRIFNEPLAVARTAHLNTMLGYLAARFAGPRPTNPQAEEQRAARDQRAAQTQAQANRVQGQAIAVIPIHGSLSARGGMDADSEKILSYNELRTSLRAALADPAFGGILLDFDSYGGEVAGLPELADEILAARARKPIFAIANTAMASAAYWLGASAERVIATPSGSVGSIGVIAAHRDQSKKDAAAGEAWTFVIAGERKLDGNPHAPLPDDVKARLQARVDRTYGLFVDHVAKARGIPAKAVRATQAEFMSALDALKAGLIDEVGTFDAAVAALTARMAAGK